jgi:hypothetical protein
MATPQECYWTFPLLIFMASIPFLVIQRRIANAKAQAQRKDNRDQLAVTD